MKTIALTTLALAISLAPNVNASTAADTAQERCCEMVDDATTVSVQNIEPLSTTSIEYGRGYASGYCGGNSGWYCMDQVKQRARDDAARDGRWSCESKRGRADTFMPSCTENCSPFSIPYDAPYQPVSCTADCGIRCELP